MKAGFYPRLALDGMAKNRRLYLPYLLTCVGMVALHYIICFLSLDPAVAMLRGGNLLTYMLELGGEVISLFAFLFLFYTHSFLMRRRKMEFGLYNILGMGKGNLAHILVWEVLATAAFSLLAGLTLGALLSKLAEMGLIRMLQEEGDYSLSISWRAMGDTLCRFGVIFLLLLLNTLRQVAFSTAITLLRSENNGEKPPRGNWLVGLAGLALLGAAYYIAVTTANPLTALAMFFIAVAMVIVGTYLVMIAGSVVFCRQLQKRKSYYYDPRHFVSVSSMAYRMKRNGAGLASICILSTMVLVMLSLTASLYVGSESVVRTRYPRELNVTLTVDGIEELSDKNNDALRACLADVVEQNGGQPQDMYCFRAIGTAGLLQADGEVELDVRDVDALDYSTYNDVTNFYFVPLSDYNAMTGRAETLASGQALACGLHVDFTGDRLAFHRGQSFAVKKHLDDLGPIANTTMGMMPTLVVVVPDLPSAIQGLDRLANYRGDPMLTGQWLGSVDTGLPGDAQLRLYEAAQARLPQLYEERLAWTPRTFSLESREAEHNELISMYAGLLYLGILLSIAFLFGTVLIIYYKQISEGYEDQARFGIMRKVGMTRRDIRRSINSQMLTVFALPLALAACHLAFAFPIVEKLLRGFLFDDTVLFGIVTAVCLLVFVLFYTLVYRATSNAYYHIVSGAQEGQI